MMEISFKDNILLRNRRKEEKKQSNLSSKLGIHWQFRPDQSHQEFGVNIKDCSSTRPIQPPKKTKTQAQRQI